MAEILRLPELATNSREAVVASWNVPLRTPYDEGEAIVTVETEKAVADVEAEAGGMLLRLLADEGETVASGSPIAIWGGPDDSDDDIATLLASLGVAADAAPVAGEPTVGNGHRVFASPIARRLARLADLTVAEIAGSGPNGRIRRRDVEAAIAAASPPPAAPPPAAEPPVRTIGDGEATPRFEDVPISRMRQAIARRLVESKSTAPHFYLRGTARVDRLLELRRELNDGEDVAVTLNDLVVKAAAAAYARVPGMNVQWNGESIRHFEGAAIAIAVATEDGLVTPVVRDVDGMGIRRLAGRTRDLIQRAHARTLRQSDLEGGSLTVTNLGMYGTEEFAAIINPPQAAILAVGAASPAPVVVDGEIRIATLMRLSLAVDHRPIDGVTAARWMSALTGLLERPLQILA
ncbi:dihydrolipoamide acetyltransferase family protein [Micromonospora sp. NPDC092111]|uniref:dihydrolipoamide acetyltransferase family protein n=1 Tax=Micromonospora sp. NPDC092111 TaxID=3364289 RepID=UPI003829B605